jgi:hypothetical protein
MEMLVSAAQLLIVDSAPPSSAAVRRRRSTLSLVQATLSFGARLSHSRARSAPPTPCFAAARSGWGV